MEFLKVSLKEGSIQFMSGIPGGVYDCSQIRDLGAEAKDNA
jgi:hypothetical protein